MIDVRLPDRSIALVLRWAVIEKGTAGLADGLGPSVVVPRPPSHFLPEAVVVCGPVILLRRERAAAAVPKTSYAVVRDAVMPGTVVLIRTDPSFGAAFGSGIALQAADSGAIAMLTNGAWRDGSRLSALGLPVGSNGADPTQPAGCPVVVSDREDLFGTTWMTGDWLLRDVDGVIRLTQEQARSTANGVAAEGSAELANLLGGG